MSARTAIPWRQHSDGTFLLVVPEGVVGYGGLATAHYWVCPGCCGKWYVEDNCGAVWGGYESALDARSAVERTIGL